MKLTDNQKKEIVYIYQEDDLLETIIFAEDKQYLTKEQAKELKENSRYNPYPNELNYWEYDTTYIYKFFDLLEITEEEFNKYTLEYEKEYE